MYVSLVYKTSVLLVLYTTCLVHQRHIHTGLKNVLLVHRSFEVKLTYIAVVFFHVVSTMSSGRDHTFGSCGSP
jgi:hypothetical protein